MTFTNIEASEEEGRPFFLYWFQFGALNWRYTNAPREIDRRGVTWHPATITHGNIIYSAGQDRRTVRVEMPVDDPIFDTLLTNVDLRDVWLRIYAAHDGASDTQELFQGVVRDITVINAKATLSCMSVDLLTYKTGLRKFATQYCTHKLFDAGCGLDPEAWKVVVYPTAVNGPELTLPSGWNGSTPWEKYLYGYAARTTTSGTELRWIVRAEETRIVLGSPFEGLQPGDEVRVYRACDKTADTCKNDFNNIENYGGSRIAPPPAGDVFFRRRG